MQIFLGAILFGFVLAFLLTLLASYIPQSMLKGLKRTLDLLESIPDLVIAVLLQALTVYAYKNMGLDLFRVAGYGDEKIYFAPIVTLAILPMISLFKIMILRVEEEFTKDYVVFVKSKGIHKARVILNHIFRNILPTAFQHSKIIIWATLSSQFIIEYLFNINGITFFIINSFTPMTIAASLILVYTPFFIFFQWVELWLYRDSIDSVEVVKLNKMHSLNPVKLVKGWITGLSHIRWSKMKPWRLITYPCAVFFSHRKNYKFAIGSLFFIIVISISVTYSITTDNHVDQERIVYNEDGSIKSTPPHPPGTPFLLGSDDAGFDLLDQLIIGGKYTLFFGLLIALLRVLIGFFAGIFFAFSLVEKVQIWIEKLVDSIHFLPLTVIAYILLQPILIVPLNMEASYTTTERIILEIIILTVFVIPLTTILIGNDMKNVLKNEFIMSAKVLGGSKLHVLWHHVLPHIGPRLAILLGQQFIQVLLIFIHLGVFTFFFGGTIYDDPPKSISNEWSGFIGAAKNSILNSESYWLAIWPLIAFMLTIFAMQFIIKGIKEVQQQKIGIFTKLPKNKRNKKADADNETREYKPTTESFQRVGGD